MSSDFITAFHTTVVRPQSGDPGGQRVGGARVAQVRTNRATPEHNPTMQATGMCKTTNYTEILAGLPVPPAWMEGAVCAQSDPEEWFPEPGRHANDAKRICASCPVREQCLEWALSMPTWADRYGVYGGLSAVERHRLRRDRANGAAA